MKGAALAALALAAAVMSYWAVTGMHFATRTQIPLEVEIVDEFGDKRTETQWKDGFELGLIDGAGPAAGALVALAAGLWVWDRRRRSAA